MPGLRPSIVVAFALAALALFLAVIGLAVGVKPVTATTEFNLFLFASVGALFSALLALLGAFISPIPSRDAPSWRPPPAPARRAPPDPGEDRGKLALRAIHVAGNLLWRSISRGGYLLRRSISRAPYWLFDIVAALLTPIAVLAGVAALAAAVVVCGVSAHANTPNPNRRVRSELTRGQRQQLAREMFQLRNSSNSTDRRFGLALGGLLAAGLPLNRLAATAEQFTGRGTELIDTVLDTLEPQLSKTSAQHGGEPVRVDLRGANLNLTLKGARAPVRVDLTGAKLSVTLKGARLSSDACCCQLAPCRRSPCRHHASSPPQSAGGHSGTLPYTP